MLPFLTECDIMCEVNLFSLKGEINNEEDFYSYCYYNGHHSYEHHEAGQYVSFHIASHYLHFISLIFHLSSFKTSSSVCGDRQSTH